MRITFLLIYFTSCLAGFSQDNKNVYSVRIPSYKQGEIIVQTGYMVKGYPGILTSLHGILHSKYPALPINAFNQADKKTYKDLNIVAYDIQNDVALLASRELKINNEGFVLGKKTLAINQVVDVVGHPKGIAQISRKATVGDPVFKQLKSLIPPSEANIDSKMLNSTVYNLIGDYLKGSSGSPILINNEVFGMVQGGLGGQISWGIPIKNWKLVGRYNSPFDIKSEFNSYSSLNPDEFFDIKNGDKPNIGLDLDERVASIDNIYIKDVSEDIFVYGIYGSIKNKFFAIEPESYVKSFNFRMNITDGEKVTVTNNENFTYKDWAFVPVADNQYYIKTKDFYLNVPCDKCAAILSKKKLNEEGFLWTLKLNLNGKYQITSTYNVPFIENIDNYEAFFKNRVNVNFEIRRILETTTMDRR